MGSVGRPPFEITGKVIAKAEKLASQGLTKKQIARVIGMGYSTLFEKENTYPELSEAIKRGQAKGVESITNALFNNALDGNITAQIFYLKNRSPEEWKDRVPETTGDTQPPTRIEIVTVDGKKANKPD